MPLELTLFLFSALVVAAWLTVWFTSRFQRLQTRRMEHRERLAAIEAGQHVGPAEPGQQGGSSMETTLTPNELNRQRVQWFQLVALALGMLSFFGGAGLLVAFTIIGEPGLARMWSIGLIPMMTGVGLILFWIISWGLIRRET